MGDKLNLSAYCSHKWFRFVIAITVSVMLHLCILAAGHFGLTWNFVPSEHNQVLTLTLDNTPQEGVLNNLDVANTKDSVEKEQVQDYATTENNDDLLNGDALSFVDTSQKLKEEEVINSLDPSELDEPKQSNNLTKIETSAIQQHKESIINEVAAQTSKEKNTASPLLTTPFKSDASVNLSQDSIGQMLPEEITVTESEQQILDQKIKLWSENMSTIANTNEPLIWQEQGQMFVAHFKRLPANGDMDLDEVMVEINTEKNGERLKTKLTMKKLAFSNFGQFVHRWNQSISLHNDEMNGRFHSNSEFNVLHTNEARTTFLDKVTTASYRVNLNGQRTRSKDIFLGGLETGVKRINMPKPRLLFSDENVEYSKRDVISVQESSRLRFLAEGAVLIEPIEGDYVSRKIILGDSPIFFFAAPKVSLHVSGTVNGSVAVYSPSKIVIEDNLLYASTRSLEQGGDFLGLVSGNDVMIAPRSVTGHGDLTINAAIYAKKRFKVSQPEGESSGLLTINGSITAGSLSETEPRYATKVIFDKRLEDVKPPGFPVTDRYELTSIDAGWARQISTNDNEMWIQSQ